METTMWGLGFRVQDLGFASIPCPNAAGNDLPSAVLWLMWAALPEVAREFRFWSAPQSCPSLALLLLSGLCLFSCGLCTGLCLGCVILNRQCRRTISFVAGWISLAFEGPLAATAVSRVDQLRRLREYRTS